MRTQVNKLRGLRGLLSFTFSLLTICLLTYITYLVISGGGIDAIKTIPKLFSIVGNTDRQQEFYFDTGKHRVFADLEDAFVSAGSLGVQIFSTDGDELARDSFHMEYPAITGDSGYAIAFDIGGTEVRTVSFDGINASLQTSNKIYSASINRNGWFCVNTRETGGYTSSVTVYNNDGKSVYKTYSAEGHILQSVLSGDNRNVAVLTLTTGGSRISLYNLNAEGVSSVFTLDGGLIIDIKYLTDGKILAITTQEIIILDKNAVGNAVYNYDGRHIAGYSQNGNQLALYLLDYSLGSSGSIILLGMDGSVNAEKRIDKKLTSISLRNGFLAALKTDGLSFYDEELVEYTPAETIDTVIASSVLTLKDRSALVAGDYSAAIMTASTTG